MDGCVVDDEVSKRVELLQKAMTMVGINRFSSQREFGGQAANVAICDSYNINY